LRFLRAHGVVHFDAHAGNVLVGDDRVLLTDFGLVLDRDFDLDDEERAMIDSHRHYDEGEALGCLAQVLRSVAKGWNDETRQAMVVRYGDTDPFTLLSHLEALVAEGHVNLPEHSRRTLLRYRDPILLMGRFFRAMRQSATKDVPYRDAELAALLHRSVGDLGT
jgi:hypothetical protein